MIRVEIRELLKRVYDIDRLMSKVVIGTVNCRDIISLKYSIGQVPYIKNLLNKCSACLNTKNYQRMDTLDDVYDLIERAIMDDPPVTIREGKIIKDGYDEKVDKLRKASTEGKDWVAAMESTERKNRYKEFKGWV